MDHGYTGITDAAPRRGDAMAVWALLQQLGPRLEPVAHKPYRFNDKLMISYAKERTWAAKSSIQEQNHL